KLKFKVTSGKDTKDVEVTLATRPADQQGGRGGFGGGGGGGAGFGGPGGATRTRPYGALYGGQRETAQERPGPDGHLYGGIYKSTDGGESWTRINSYNPRPMYFSLLRVDPQDENYLYVGGVTLARSSDGGKTIKFDVGRQVHADHHALWIDPKDGRHALIGCDGGFYATYDRM